MTERVCRRPCCGCQEQRGTINVEHLGWVCEWCFEVVDIVFEVEIERVNEARRAIEKFLVDFERHGFRPGWEKRE